MSYKIDWNQKKPSLNPALDFDEDTAYLTQYLHAKHTIKKKTKDGEKEVEKDAFLPFLITSNRQTFPLTEDTIESLPYYIESIPQFLRNRQWSTEKISAFIKRQDTCLSFPEVFEKVRTSLMYYLDFHNPEMYDYLACWTMATYFHPLFNTFPELYLNAIKRSGKTKTLETITLMSFNGKLFMSPSDSTMFRLTQTNRCTILIDEVKRLKGKSESNLRDFIRGKYKKGISVPRAEEKKTGKGYEIQDYELYGPLAMANIKGLEDDMIDRTHWLTLRRTTGEKGNRDVDYSSKRWIDCRDDLYLLTLTKFDQIKQAKRLFESMVESGREYMSYEKMIIDKEETPSCLSLHLSTGVTIYHPLLSTNLTNRYLELAKPILVIASLISPEVAENVFRFVSELNSKQEMEESADSFEKKLVQCLIDICRVKVEGGRVLPEIEAKEIFDKLSSDYYSYAPEWLTPIKIGLTMKSLGSYAEKKSIHGRTIYILSLDELNKIANSLKLEIEESPTLKIEEIDMKIEESEE